MRETLLTKKFIEGCLRNRLWIIAIITSSPCGGTERANLLNFFAKAAARNAGRCEDFKQVSRSYKRDHKKS